jgi:uncharacterized protein YjbI with pentapeptide repeats
VTSRFFSKQSESVQLAIVAAVSGAIFGAVVARSVGSGWFAAIGLGGLCGVGLFLWALDANKSWGNLGEGLLVSVVVAVVLLVVQNDADERTRKSDRQRDDALRKASETQNLRLTIGLRRDLTGMDLRDRPLQEALLADKLLNGAYLDGAHLERAILRGAKLRRATGGAVVLTGADLTDADLTRADLSGEGSSRSFLQGARLSDATLTGAVLIRAVLSAADLRGAVMRRALLQGADLRKADLREADLTSANLHTADLRGARLQGARLCKARLENAKLAGVEYSDSTRWPRSFDPVAAGVEKADPALPASAEALTGEQKRNLAVALEVAALTESFEEPALTTTTSSPIPTPTPAAEADARQGIAALVADRELRSLVAPELDGPVLRTILAELQTLPPDALAAAILALESPVSERFPRCRT